MDALESGQTFLGFMAMMDPPRPDVAEAVKVTHKAGIRIIMITGDYGLTAETIARNIGIITGDNVRIVTGVELESMDDAALEAVVKDEVILHVLHQNINYAWFPPCNLWGKWLL